MKVGDWVFFKTRNWPKDGRPTAIDSATGKMKDILAGSKLYAGRGKIIGIAGSNYTVREEETGRLVEVGPHPEDEIHKLDFDYRTLTLGDLRAFVEEHKNAPNDIPVMVALPLGFFGDEGDLPPDHPEYKAPITSDSVEACGLYFYAMCEDGDVATEYIPPEDRGAADWRFCIDVIPNPEQCYAAMREREEE